jgi:hypothetical protein
MAQIPPWIFICYRRGSGAEHAASRIASLIEGVCGAGSVFLDRRSLEIGAHWENTLLMGLTQSLVVIPLIGPDWSPAKLHNPADWVRRELFEAFRQHKYILPLLLDGGRMPDERELPNDIIPLTKIQGYFVDSRSDAIFEASLMAVISVFRTYFKTKLKIEREVEWWWKNPKSIMKNEWVLSCEGQVLLALAGADTFAIATILPGKYQLVVRWDEKQFDPPGDRFRMKGYNSAGNADPLTTTLWPGKYTFGMTKLQLEKQKNWFSRFFDDVNGLDERRRVLTQFSFEPFPEL